MLSSKNSLQGSFTRQARTHTGPTNYSPSIPTPAILGFRGALSRGPVTNTTVVQPTSEHSRRRRVLHSPLHQHGRPLRSSYNLGILFLRPPHAPLPPSRRALNSGISGATDVTAHSICDLFGPSCSQNARTSTQRTTPIVNKLRARPRRLLHKYIL